MLTNLILLIIALTGFINLTANFVNVLGHHAHISDMTIHYPKVCVWAICLAYLIAYCQTEIPVLWGMR